VPFETDSFSVEISQRQADRQRQDEQHLSHGQIPSCRAEAL
jgi:hypothetical protein